MSLDTFMSVYERHLRAVHAERSDEYMWPASEMPIVVSKMRVAVERGSYSKDSLSFKRTCKELGIRYTYKGINEFVKGGA